MRLLTVFLAALLWCSASFAAPPALDGQTTFAGCNAGGSPLTAHITLTTVNSQDAIIVMVIFGNTNSFVHTIIDTAGLTFTRRTALRSQLNANDIQEEWWAPAPSPLSSDTITVTALPNVSSGCMKAFAIGISGAEYPFPFDPYFNYPVSNPSTVPSFTTQGTSDFLLTFFQLFLCTSGSTPGAGWTAIYNPSGSQAQVLVQYQQVTSTVSGLTPTLGSCSPSGSIQSTILDAFVAPGGLGSLQQSSKLNSYVILQTGMGTSKQNMYVIAEPGIGTSKQNGYVILEGQMNVINPKTGQTLFHAFPP